VGKKFSKAPDLPFDLEGEVYKAIVFRDQPYSLELILSLRKEMYDYYLHGEKDNLKHRLKSVVENDNGKNLLTTFNIRQEKAEA